MEANRSDAWSVVALGAVAPVVWGSTYIVTTELLPPGRPMTAAVLRAIPAGLLLVVVFRQWPRAWFRLVVLSMLNIGAFFPLLFVAAYRLPGGLAAIVGAGQPLVVALFALLLGLGAAPRRQICWAVVAVIGVAVAMTTGVMAVDALGVVAAAAGMASMALGITLTRLWGAPGGLSGVAATGWQLLLGGVIILPLVPLVDRGQFVLDGGAVLGYAWLSLVGGALAYALWFHAARRLPATATSLLGPLSPVTAAILGWALLGQLLTPVQVLGFGLAMTAAILGQRAPRSRVPRATAPQTPATSTIRWYPGR